MVEHANPINLGRLKNNNAEITNSIIGILHPTIFGETPNWLINGIFVIAKIKRGISANLLIAVYTNRRIKRPAIISNKTDFLKNDILLADREAIVCIE